MAEGLTARYRPYNVPLNGKSSTVHKTVRLKRIDGHQLFDFAMKQSASLPRQPMVILKFGATIRGSRSRAVVSFEQSI